MRYSAVSRIISIKVNAIGSFGVVIASLLPIIYRMTISTPTRMIFMRDYFFPQSSERLRRVLLGGHGGMAVDVVVNEDVTIFTIEHVAHGGPCRL